jgi:hypothetical protein
MSAQTDRLLVRRSIRCDARNPTHAQHDEVENVSRSFHAHREPQQSTRFGLPSNNSYSRFKDGTFLMRLPSVMGGARSATCCYGVAPSFQIRNDNISSPAKMRLQDQTRSTLNHDLRRMVRPAIS